jgi:pimeloyl-ACP methyl ester carboxylesterase
MRIVLIHGSGGNSETAWGPLRPLGRRHTLIAPNRGGYPPNPPLERIDFEQQAEQLSPLLEDGAHLVGHSYGGVIAMLIAARRPEAILSLMVSEPPAFGVARGNPDVERLVQRLDRHFSAGPRDPREFAQGFMAIVGSNAKLPEALSSELEQGVRALMAERPPWEAAIPLDELAAAPFRKLVISGGHSAAFDAVCDVLEERLGAERAVLPGAGHGLARAPGYLEQLEEFLER